MITTTVRTRIKKKKKATLKEWRAYKQDKKRMTQPTQREGGKVGRRSAAKEKIRKVEKKKIKKIVLKAPIQHTKHRLATLQMGQKNEMKVSKSEACDEADFWR